MNEPIKEGYIYDLAVNLTPQRCMRKQGCCDKVTILRPPRDLRHEDLETDQINSASPLKDILIIMDDLPNLERVVVFRCFLSVRRSDSPEKCVAIERYRILCQSSGFFG